MSKFGIDVSEHQGTINWDSVKSQISFAILRLGWIGNKNNHTIDKQFERNYSECKRLGIPVGVYLYNYCNCEDTAKAGANWALQHLQGKALELPVYIDMEDNEFLNEEIVYDLADLFKVFSDSTRIRILVALFDGELCVGEIAQKLEMSQTAISHQLRVLKQNHLIKYRRQGKSMIYSLADEHVKTIINCATEHVEE